MNLTPTLELRSAVRFPLHLPVSVKSPSAEHFGETTDISAAGVLFWLDTDLPLGTEIEFSVLLPPEMLGELEPVQVCCLGRVVRTSLQAGRQSVAAIIDEYRFEKL